MLINYDTNDKTTNYKKKLDGLGQWVACNDIAIQKHLFELYRDFKWKKVFSLAQKQYFSNLQSIEFFWNVMKYLSDKSSKEINTFVFCGICAKLVGARLPAPGKIFGHTDFFKSRWDK